MTSLAQQTGTSNADSDVVFASVSDSDIIASLSGCQRTDRLSFDSDASVHACPLHSDSLPSSQTVTEVCHDLHSMHQTATCLKAYEADMTLHTCLLTTTEIRTQRDLTSHATTDHTGTNSTSGTTVCTGLTTHTNSITQSGST